MQEQHLDSLKALNYSDLSKEEVTELKNAENEFNSNFNKNVYFMVIEK
ncbi:hypothetical protein [Sinanaerobacter sp. ZZT-01]|nr:hypothetical protein [Sinanaerobacter sp. ZZT-01]WRR94465.1 hypothetical protein U5921_04930 [Sinanaerobacter sp. ZZT-01]